MNNLEPKEVYLDSKYAVPSAPARHVFLIGTVWYLTKSGKKSDFSILEVGSWLGASALTWSQALKLHNNTTGTITCVDAWKPYVDKTTHNDNVYTEMEGMLESGEAMEIFMHNIDAAPEDIKFNIEQGNSAEILEALSKGSFDIAYIDADHAYESVLMDISLAKILVKDGGIICGDDLNLQLHECDEENARKNAAIDFIEDPKTGRNFHPGVTIAVAEALGEVSSWGGYWAMQRNTDKWQKISLKEMPIHYPDHFSQELVSQAEDHLKDISIN